MARFDGPYKVLECIGESGLSFRFAGGSEDIPVGNADAEGFVKAFQHVYRKLVFEELSLTAAQRFFLATHNKYIGQKSKRIHLKRIRLFPLNQFPHRFPYALLFKRTHRQPDVIIFLRHRHCRRPDHRQRRTSHHATGLRQLHHRQIPHLNRHRRNLRPLRLHRRRGIHLRPQLRHLPLRHLNRPLPASIADLHISNHPIHGNDLLQHVVTCGGSNQARDRPHDSLLQLLVRQVRRRNRCRRRRDLAVFTDFLVFEILR
ncbi:hypothetical protein OSB04_029297 [Centaurea solstitialis]|uniref:Uncharacterized protein n=1 Tax=Centaurea solstitialis TaxID=347529 RepID=A0AA38SVR2_9ASTR|nr:hypothetical protein OSB04_029297 [Centaurea solstitialis]